jgi:hypothetical protein
MQFDSGGSFQSKVIENALKKETTMIMVSGFGCQVSGLCRV